MGTDQDRRKHLLSSEPICDSFWTKSNGGTNPEGRDSSSLGIFVNRNCRDSEECGELFGGHGAAKQFDSIGQCDWRARQGEV
jgi:hypothetical protein